MGGRDKDEAVAAKLGILCFCSYQLKVNAMNLDIWIYIWT